MSEVQIRPVQPSDAQRLADIYNPYIHHSIVTFELEQIDEAEMLIRIDRVCENNTWLVAELQGDVVGYAYNDRWRTRAAYDRSTELAVYVDASAQGMGVGKMLYLELIKALKQQDFHALIAGISLPNDASVALHEKLGFKKVAHFEEVGYKFDRWIDVGYWELKI